MNKTSRCVNHVCTLPPKLLSDIKKFEPGSIFCIFTSVESILIGKDDEYEKRIRQFWTLTLLSRKYILNQFNITIQKYLNVCLQLTNQNEVVQ